MRHDDLLALLEQNIDLVLADNRSLREELSRLNELNEQQRQEMMRTHAEYLSLREDYNRLRQAHALLVQSPERDVVKRQLTRMIQLVDKAIENLKAAEG